MMQSKMIFKQLLNVILLSSSLVAYADTAEKSPTKIIDHFFIYDVPAEIAKQKLSNPSADARDILTIKQTNGFEVDPKNGNVWVMLNYIGAVVNSSDNGTTSFDVSPDGIAVPAMDSFMLFESQHMAKLAQNKTPSIEIGGKTIALSEEILKRIMTDEQFKAYITLRDQSETPLQLIQFKQYQISKATDTRILMTLTKLQNMKPNMIEVIVGQGTVPEVLKNYIKRQNGSWFYRYRDFMWMLLAAAAFWFFVIRRLLAR